MAPLMPKAQTAFLLVQDLPSEANEAAMAALFGQYKGFLGVKQKKGTGETGGEGGEEVVMDAAGAKSNAFTIEFSSPANAATAQRALSGFKLTPTDVLDIEFI